VHIEPNRGFFVKPLNQREAREIYEVLSDLECLAVRVQGPIADQHHRDLSQLNREITTQRDPKGLVLADNHWHRKLIEGCGNNTLSEVIEQLRQRNTRYGSVEDAETRIRRHWRRSQKSIDMWSDSLARGWSSPLSPQPLHPIRHQHHASGRAFGWTFDERNRSPSAVASHPRVARGEYW